MNSVEFLDAVREKHDIPSQRKLAQFFDVPDGHINNYYRGRRKLEAWMCRKVAAALELDPGYVMAEIEAERAKRTEDADAWHRVAEIVKRSQAAALVGLLAIGLVSLPSVAQAADPGSVYYVK